ncbi:MAG TPA: peptide ABC transporter substrate-binding protein [Candidatus Tumulicola sp.]
MRSLCLPAMLAIALLGTGCSKGGEPPGELKGRLRIALPINPTQLNPILTQNSAESFADGLIFNLLVKHDARHRQIPDLAEIVPTLANGGISRDARTVTYRLRRNVRWQDGVPFTSRDVVFTWHAILNPRNDVVSRGAYDRVKSMDAPDPYTVVVHFKTPFAGAVDTVFGESDVPMRVLPAHLLQGEPDLNHVAFDAAPVGTGPYRFVRWLRGDRIELEANPYYFGGAPHIEHLTLQIVTDPSTVELQLRSHEIDLGIELPATVYRALASVPGITLKTVAAPIYTAIYFNTRQQLLRDVRVRRALVFGANRAEIVRNNGTGVTQVATADLSPYHWAFDPALKPLPYDPAAAGTLLDRAGWHRGPDGIRTKGSERLSLLFAFPSSSQIMRDVAVQLQQMYRGIGVDLDLKGYDYTVYYAAAQSGGVLSAGHYDLGIRSSKFGSDPDDSSDWTCAAIPPAGTNYTRYCSPRMERLQQVATTDPRRAARARAYRQIESLLLDDAPAAFISYQPFRYAYASDLRNFFPNGISETWNAQQWAR